MQHRTSRLISLGFGVLTSLLVSHASSLYAQESPVTQHYTQKNLVADTSGVAAVTDPNLVNPWGLARSSSSPWWVSDNGPGLSTLYSGTGSIASLVVTIPPADATSGSTGTPTGVVFNGTTDFALAPGMPADFLFVTEDGTISGWNPGVKATAAVIVVNTHEASVFKGATIATLDGHHYLYVADFRKGRVQVFNASFQHVDLIEDAFVDDRIPDGFAPFNVQDIGDNLFVTYAEQDSAKHDEVDGAGLGYVDVFSPAGRLLQRLQAGPWFNAPWGVTQAPSDFGLFSHDLLVGQFGSGEILVFNPITGAFKGRLHNSQNMPIVIGGLWDIAFGNGGNAGAANTLYFTAGSDQEQHGLFGNITPVENLLGGEE
jgi:uncharacterized protein (TIGR03118 family)